MKILANDGISASGVKALEAAKFEVITVKVAQERLIQYINENDIKALLVRSATTARKDLIDGCPGLQLIGRGGVGMDNIDVAYAKEKGLHAECFRPSDLRTNNKLLHRKHPVMKPFSSHLSVTAA